LDERGVIDAAGRHIGLVFLLNVDGANWAINLENEDRAFYGLPIIRFSNGDEECPLAMATASLDRRTGDYLRTVVENYEAEFNTAAEESRATCSRLSTSRAAPAPARAWAPRAVRSDRLAGPAGPSPWPPRRARA